MPLPGKDLTASNGLLVLVATPIGNLADISARALDTLRNANSILCEDTRVTSKLLRHYGITNTLLTLHDHNEEERLSFLLTELKKGKIFALISDAGTPVFSDPGYRLVRAALQNDIKVTALPGPNAAITALVLSGFPPAPFMFLGFPPRGEARKSHFVMLKAAEQTGLKATLSWYESPRRLVGTLETLAEVFGPDREASVGRELTKLYEEVRRGPLSTLISHFKETDPRGEITLLLAPAAEDDNKEQDLEPLLLKTLKTHSLKDAVTLIAGSTNLPRKFVYKKALALSQKNTTKAE
ncbi:16S rRNA (cytidine(1402)-2'-O)-methyltransferase [Aristophania vespae]|uniref:Ribosomal RNA small subunit methyltransferase I n=2 Tax=Aristophania vespae TaxID=2697033 RepID=A0A6P1NHN5_9PROT|nr:16S rRNA (cytidine(1402)-2'-O)-methyltransferase [Aristophania vespae]UMM63318.1 Ribosomal RNA small subunit methyltransferase I [Aristophania vespae]